MPTPQLMHDRCQSKRQAGALPDIGDFKPSLAQPVHGPALHSWMPTVSCLFLARPVHVPALQVDPQFYAFRWITLCLAQEFAFPDTLRIWDTILSDPHGRMDCLLRICASMIILARERLLKVCCVGIGCLHCGQPAHLAGWQANLAPFLSPIL
eukprot:233971-Pelagomonas_calceolata.AAC.5